MEQLTSSFNTRKSSELFYKVVVKNARWSELWRLTKPKVLEFAAGGFVKLFRIDLPMAHAFAAHDIVPMELSEVPEHVTSQLAKGHEELCQLGFTASFAFSIPVLGNGENFAVVFQHREEDRVGGLIYQRLEQNGLTELEAGIAISSRSHEEGQIYTTTNMAKRLDPPKGCRVEIVHLDSAAEVNASHSQLLQSSGETWEQLSGNRVWQLLADCHKLEVEDQMARGVIKRITEKEMRSL